MLRKLFLITIAVLMLAVLAVPTSGMTTRAQSPAAWQEGATLATGNCGIQGGGYRITTITANKFIDRAVPSRVSTFEIYITSGIYPVNTVSTLIGPVTVAVPIDPDYLSVSRDLGWAGLDASVVLFDAATQTNVPVDIHLAWFANAGVTQEGYLYKRAATISGSVTLKGINFVLACEKTGYIFSTREPKPRY